MMPLISPFGRKVVHGRVGAELGIELKSRLLCDQASDVALGIVQISENPRLAHAVGDARGFLIPIHPVAAEVTLLDDPGLMILVAGVFVRGRCGVVPEVVAPRPESISPHKDKPSCRHGIPRTYPYR